MPSLNYYLVTKLKPKTVVGTVTKKQPCLGRFLIKTNDSHKKRHMAAPRMRYNCKVPFTLCSRATIICSTVDTKNWKKRKKKNSLVKEDKVTAQKIDISGSSVKNKENMYISYKGNYLYSDILSHRLISFFDSPHYLKNS